MRRRFAFLDRDGTLLRDPGYLHRLEDYALLPGVCEGLRELRDAGFWLAIVTNQSGIGRGWFTERDFLAVQERLLDDLANAGIRIEATYHCPHAPEEGCACRKPGVALLERARRELRADLAQSWVIGDAPRDVEMALRVGCGAVYLGDDPSVPAEIPRARDLRDAARVVTGRSGPR
jgi:histidinol-phosphate phosphatase family protein